MWTWMWHWQYPAIYGYWIMHAMATSAYLTGSTQPNMDAERHIQWLPTHSWWGLGCNTSSTQPNMDNKLCLQWLPMNLVHCDPKRMTTLAASTFWGDMFAYAKPFTATFIPHSWRWNSCYTIKSMETSAHGNGGPTSIPKGCFCPVHLLSFPSFHPHMESKVLCMRTHYVLTRGGSPAHSSYDKRGRTGSGVLQGDQIHTPALLPLLVDGSFSEMNSRSHSWATDLQKQQILWQHREMKMNSVSAFTAYSAR